MGKLFKAVVAAAAIGSVCYVFKDKIKATKAYQTLGVDEKVEKVKTTIKDKMPIKDEAERDYFTLSDDDQTNDNNQSNDDNQTNDDNQSNDDNQPNDDISEEAVTETATMDDEATEEASAPTVTVVNDETSASDVSAIVDDLLSDIPEISIGSEDMGLSDVSEDFDVLAEQDKLDV